MKLLLQSNTRNMTTLWKRYSAESIALSKGSIFFNTQWPHKVWLEGHLENYEYSFFIESVRSLLYQNPLRAFATWDKLIENIFSSSEAVNLIKNDNTSSLVGMSLDLNAIEHGAVASELPLMCHDVSSNDVNFWTELCSRGFGYQIDACAINSVVRHSDVSLLWYSYKNEPVGTALIAATGSIAGFHQIAVLPKWRGKGIARGIVTQIILRAFENGATEAVLQASKMGLGVYEKLGFVENFEIKYYRIET